MSPLVVNCAQSFWQSLIKKYYLCLFSAGDGYGRGSDLDVDLGVFVRQLEGVVEYFEVLVEGQGGPR